MNKKPVVGGSLALLLVIIALIIIWFRGED